MNTVKKALLVAVAGLIVGNSSVFAAARPAAPAGYGSMSAVVAVRRPIVEVPAGDGETGKIAASSETKGAVVIDVSGSEIIDIVPDVQAREKSTEASPSLLQALGRGLSHSRGIFSRVIFRTRAQAQAPDYASAEKELNNIVTTAIANAEQIIAKTDKLRKLSAEEGHYSQEQSYYYVQQARLAGTLCQFHIPWVYTHGGGNYGGGNVAYLTIDALRLFFNAHKALALMKSEFDKIEKNNFVESTLTMDSKEMSGMKISNLLSDIITYQIKASELLAHEGFRTLGTLAKNTILKNLGDVVLAAKRLARTAGAVAV